MKAKLPMLIAASLFIFSVSKAQYGGPCANDRMVIQGQYGIPGRAVLAINYNHSARDRNVYDDHREGYVRYDNNQPDYGRYDDHRDWRAVEYDRYCHENRGYRMSREEYYRTRCDVHVRPNYAPQRVVVYHY